jgi:hypothetical protein
MILGAVFVGSLTFLGICAAIIFSILPFVAAWRFMKAHRSLANDLNTIAGYLKVE